VQVPSRFGHWVPAGVCDNRVGYFEVANSRVVYQADGQTRSFGIASMISWRGTWNVIHLGAILRSSDQGIVADPEVGAGISPDSNHLLSPAAVLGSPAPGAQPAEPMALPEPPVAAGQGSSCPAHPRAWAGGPRPVREHDRCPALAQPLGGRSRGSGTSRDPGGSRPVSLAVRP
jgi:hypothetical protein